MCELGLCVKNMSMTDWFTRLVGVRGGNAPGSEAQGRKPAQGGYVPWLLIR
jgi:hypothetical protein